MSGEPKKKVPSKRMPGTFLIYIRCASYSRFIVSVAIISSSSVGITTTFTFESSAEITASSPRTWFFCSSNFTPRNSKPLQHQR